MLNLPLFALIPLGPSDIGVAKYFASVMLEATKAHSVTSSPAFAFITESVNREAAYAILSVADPAPSLAFTTSVAASLNKRYSSLNVVRAKYGNKNIFHIRVLP